MDLRGSLRGFVDCGIVWRSSLVRRVIGRMYSANWGDIVLDSERSGLVLCMSRLWIIIVVRTEGMWTWVGMKGCEPVQTLGSVCRRDFV